MLKLGCTLDRTQQLMDRGILHFLQECPLKETLAVSIELTPRQEGHLLICIQCLAEVGCTLVIMVNIRI